MRRLIIVASLSLLVVATVGLTTVPKETQGSTSPVAVSTKASGENTGPRGPTGVRGPIGPRGPRGYRGLNGLNGINGINGPQGLTGPQGPAGATGPQGVTGPQGPTGLQGETGPTGAQGNTGLAGADGEPWTPSIGSFYDTTLQSLAAVNSPQPMTLNRVSDGLDGVVARGVSVVAPGRITVSEAGVYNIQFSAQLDKTDPGTDFAEIWLALNGQNNPIPWTNTEVAVASTGKAVAAWNFVVDLQDNDFVQLMWSSADINMRLFAQPADVNPVRPGVPSLIVTVTQIG